MTDMERLSSLGMEPTASQLEAALLSGQFHAWYQPQCAVSGAVVGAEVLARWEHPTAGVVEPSFFLSAMEACGLLPALDRQMCQEACACLQRRQRAELSPVPLSLNLSPATVKDAELVAFLEEALENHGIPKESLRLEMPEAVFASEASGGVSAALRLRDAGFFVVMDRFGESVSTFSALQNAPVDAVKLDMRAFRAGESGERSGNLLESAVRMVRWLGLPVFAQGVETRNQADFLSSVGCEVMQGFLFAKPLPQEAFAALGGAPVAALSAKEPMALEQRITAFWDPDSIESKIFSHFAGGACVFEYRADRIEMIRVNDSYMQTFHPKMDRDVTLRADPRSILSEPNRQKFDAALQKAISASEPQTVEVVCGSLYGNLLNQSIRITLRLIDRCQDRFLLYGSIENVTAQRMAEKKAQQTSERVHAIMQNVNSGVAAFQEENIPHAILFANDQYYQQRGYTKEQYENEVRDFFSLIHPKDRDRIRRLTHERKSEPYTCAYRIVKRDGTTTWMQRNVTVCDLPYVDGPVQLAVTTDISSAEQTMEICEEVLNNLPCGAGIVRYQDGVLTPLFLNDSFRKLNGVAPGASPNLGDLLQPYDRAMLIWAIDNARENKQDVSVVLRVKDGKDGFLPFYSTLRIVEDGPAPLIYLTSYPIAPDTRPSELTAGDFVAQTILQYDCLSLLSDEKNMGMMSVYLEKDYPIRYVSSSVAKRLGYADARELTAALDGKWSNLPIAADRKKAAESCVKQLKESDVYSIEYRVYAKDGKVCWLKDSGRRGQSENGRGVLNCLILDITSQKEAEERLRHREQLALRHQKLADMLFQNDHISVWEYDIAGKTIREAQGTDTARELEAVMRNVPDSMIESGYVHPDSAKEYKTMYERLAKGSPYEEGVFLVQNTQRTGYWYERVRYSTAFDERGKPFSAVGVSQNVTKEMEAQAAYKRELDASKQPESDIFLSALINLSKKRLEQIHATTEELGEQFAGASYQNLFSTLRRALCANPEADQYFSRLRPEQLVSAYEFGETKISYEFLRFMPEIGKDIWLMLDIRLLRSPKNDELCAFLYVRDIDERRREHERLIGLNEHDSMTGLLNQYSTFAAIRKCLRGEGQYGVHAMLLLNLDDFKEINQIYGQEAGDGVICQFASRLHTFFRDYDIVGRIGGDEFMVFIRNIDSAKVVSARTEQLQKKLRDKYAVRKSRVTVNCSIGISVYTRGDLTFEQLHRNAEKSLKAQKLAARGAAVAKE